MFYPDVSVGAFGPNNKSGQDVYTGIGPPHGRFGAAKAAYNALGGGGRDVVNLRSETDKIGTPPALAAIKSRPSLQHKPPATNTTSLLRSGIAFLWPTRKSAAEPQSIKILCHTPQPSYPVVILPQRSLSSVFGRHNTNEYLFSQFLKPGWTDPSPLFPSRFMLSFCFVKNSHLPQEASVSWTQLYYQQTGFPAVTPGEGKFFKNKSDIDSFFGD